MDIQSKEVIDKIANDLKVQPAAQIPRELSKNIQLTYDCNSPKDIIVDSLGISDTASTGMFTTSSKKRTFVSSLLLSINKDAVNDGINSSIQAFPKTNNEEIKLIQINYEPTTAGQFTHSITFPIPIELKKNTVVRLVNNAATASIDAFALVFYYEEDPL